MVNQILALSMIIVLAITNFTMAQSNTNNIADNNAAQPAIQTRQTPQKNKVPIVQANRRSISLNFRLADWQKIQSKEMGQAQEIMETLQSIGCEVTGEQQDGILNISYRCVDWKAMKLDTEQQVVEWQTWLTNKGIDSVVLNPSPKTALPTVSFRMTNGRSAHIHDLAQAQALEETFKMLGCKVSTHAHNGHVDLSVQCKEWLTIGLTSEPSAHSWQDWLKKNGFETRHTHVK